MRKGFLRVLTHLNDDDAPQLAWLELPLHVILSVMILTDRIAFVFYRDVFYRDVVCPDTALDVCPDTALDMALDRAGAQP
jgi:hypothetical protein